MKSCPECGGDVRDPHSFCPECGAPISAPAKATARRRGSGEGDGSAGGADGSDGLSRRNLLMYGGAAVGTAAVGGGAGFLLLSGGSGDPGDPAERARAFYEALRQGNLEEAESMIHPDSPIQDIPAVMAGGSSGGGNVSIDSVETLRETETHAKVSIRSSASFDNRTITTNVTVPLEAHEGEWLVNVTRP